MNWIEMLFHLSPDDGSGAFELLLCFVLAVFGTIITAHVRRVMRHASVLPEICSATRK